MNRTLPNRPHLGFLKQQAKDLLFLHRRRDPAVCESFRRLRRFEGSSNDQILGSQVTLHEAQFILAMDYGFNSWDAMKKHVLGRTAEDPRPSLERSGDRVWIEGIPNLGWGTGRECTYAGALAAALSVTENPVSATDILGFTGLAFRVRWWQPGDGTHAWCPSSPVGEFLAEEEAFQRASGWDFADVNRMSKEEEPQMELFYEPIIDSIDMGYPAIGYPEKGDLNVAVAYGYEKGEDIPVIIWDTYWSREPKEVPANRMGPWFSYPINRVPAPEPTRSVIDAIAGDWWRDGGRDAESGRSEPVGPHYLLGDRAFGQWMDDLAHVEGFTEDQKRSLFFVSWWCFDTLCDARATASVFLNEKARIFEADTASYLRRAAAVYGEEGKLLGGVFAAKDAFLGPWSGKTLQDWSPALRGREIELLQSVRRVESEAMSLLDSALEAF